MCKLVDVCHRSGTFSGQLWYSCLGCGGNIAQGAVALVTTQGCMRANGYGPTGAAQGSLHEGSWSRVKLMSSWSSIETRHRTHRQTKTR